MRQPAKIWEENRGNGQRKKEKEGVSSNIVKKEDHFIPCRGNET